MCITLISNFLLNRLLHNISVYCNPLIIERKKYCSMILHNESTDKKYQYSMKKKPKIFTMFIGNQKY